MSNKKVTSPESHDSDNAPPQKPKRSIKVSPKSISAAKRDAIWLKAIAEQRPIVIFPEGTRQPVGAPPNYRAGGAIVAATLGVPVIPVALNAGEFWPRLGFIKWPGTISVRIGPPIPTDGRKATEVIEATEAWIESAMQDITSAGFKRVARAAGETA